MTATNHATRFEKTPRRTLRRLLALLVVSSCMLVIGCDDNNAGAPCSNDAQCDTGYCCKKKECGGMCSFQCRDDYDCPSNMGCEHDVCLFLCDDDRDCAERESCEHNRGVCEVD